MKPDEGYSQVRTADVETPTEIEEETATPKSYSHPALSNRTYKIIGFISLLNIIVLVGSLLILRSAQQVNLTAIKSVEPSTPVHQLQPQTQTCWLSDSTDLQQSPVRITSDREHPLDPLTTKELKLIVEVMDNYRKEKLMDVDVISTEMPRGCGNTGPMTTFTKVMYSTLAILEPPKFKKWKKGDTLPPREAYAVYHVNRHNSTHSYEMYIDILRQSVLRVNNITDTAQPSITDMETDGLVHILKLDDRWKNSMMKRGYMENPHESSSEHSHTSASKSIDDISCIPINPQTRDTHKRQIQVKCYDRNQWSSPIENLSAIIDLDEITVLDVMDDGIIPVLKNPSFTKNPSRHANRIFSVQPRGTLFTITGNVISWDEWNFHFKQDIRSGYTISDGSFQKRKIFHKIYLAESLQSTINSNGIILDEINHVGILGLGSFMTPLQLGRHCPDHAHIMNVDMPKSDGTMRTILNGLCMYEHYDHPSQKIKFIIRAVFHVHQYEYTMDTEFTQHGEITCRVYVNGMTQVGTGIQNMIAENTIGFTTEHYFSYHVDMDIDGEINSFQVASKEYHRDQNSSLVSMKQNIVQDEISAQYSYHSENPQTWSFMSGKQNSFGNDIGYEIVPKSVILNPSTQIPFFKKNLYVTPFDETQKYPLGEYPYQNIGEDGLPKWSAVNRSIKNTDLVAWYTMGVRHVPTQEDYPVMRTLEAEFTLRPLNFFNANVAMDVTDASDSFTVSECIKQ